MSYRNSNMIPVFSTIKFNCRELNQSCNKYTCPTQKHSPSPKQKELEIKPSALDHQTA